MSFKCILGFHRYEKFMGPENLGSGRFQQKYKCSRCGKIKTKIS
jgi:hypothetical protein